MRKHEGNDRQAGAGILQAGRSTGTAAAPGGTQGNGELYYAPEHILKQANVREYEELYRRSVEDPQGFWAERAEELEWFQPWDRVLDDSEKPFYKWFIGGKTNIVYNALDRHLKTSRKNKVALIWEGEPGDTRMFSYFSLNREVCKFANVLRSMGVKKGDIVTIYLPRIPEQVIAMLACAKIGAVHSVVYGGFSVEALAERIEDAQSQVLITADGGWLRGKVVRLKDIADEAMARQPTIETCIVVQRTGQEIYMEAGRDYWYHDLMALPIASPVCQTESDGRRGPALHPVHLRHHRPAQGHRAHPRRVHGARLHDPEVRVRHQGRGPLVVRRRPGLDHRPQLHRLRPAARSGPPASCTRAPPTTPTPTAGGRWWRSTASPSCTPRPRPSAA